MIKLKSFRKPTIILVVVLGIVWLFYLYVRVNTWRGTIRDVSEMPWGGNLVAKINPSGAVLAEVSFSYSLDGYFASAFGQCDEASHKNFVSLLDLATVDGTLLNDSLVRVVPSERRDGFVFSETDTVHYGKMNIDVEQFFVYCCYSKETGYFLIDFEERW